MALTIGLGIVALVLMVRPCIRDRRAGARLVPDDLSGPGFVLGPTGIRLVRLTPDNQVLHIVAVLALSLVLFLDAVNLERAQERHDLVVPLLTLGPGTLLVIAMTAVAAFYLLHLPVALALLLAAILALSDPVVLRDVTQDARLPTVVRRALSIESGANDAVVLPIVLVMVAVAGQHVGGGGEWALFLFRLPIVDPLCGFVIGGLGAWLMTQTDVRFGIRREFQSIYGLGRAGTPPRSPGRPKKKSARAASAACSPLARTTSSGSAQRLWLSS